MGGLLTRSVRGSLCTSESGRAACHLGLAKRQITTLGLIIVTITAVSVIIEPEKAQTRSYYP